MERAIQLDIIILSMSRKYFIKIAIFLIESVLFGSVCANHRIDLLRHQEFYSFCCYAKMYNDRTSKIHLLKCISIYNLMDTVAFGYIQCWNFLHTIYHIRTKKKAKGNFVLCLSCEMWQKKQQRISF